MKKIAIFIVLSLILLVIPINRSDSSFNPYYSGDAINYNNQVIFGSTNSGYLEIFRLDGDQIFEISRLKIFNQTYNSYEDFSDFKLNIENDRLYAYAVSGYTLYKYDISDLSGAHLVKKVKNTYWDWYSRVDTFGSEMGVVSKSGVKIVNPNLDQIDSFSFTAENPYNIRSTNNEFLFSVDEGKIKVFNRYSRSLIREISLEFRYDNANYKIYYDTVYNQIFAIDDYSVKKFAFDGTLLKTFRHLDHPGYDVVGNNNSPYVYFSNGLGIVKLNKSDLSLSDYAFTTNFASPQGWAMGLSLVSTNIGDHLIIFNNSNILVLDKDLNKIAFRDASYSDSSQYPGENLFLYLERNWGVATQTVNLIGGGFWSRETLTIDLGGNKTEILTDNTGRFNYDLPVPFLDAGLYDINVKGSDSGLSYNISFEIK